MPRISISDKDIERGKRFRKTCADAFQGKSLRSIGRALGGYSSSRMDGWTKGDGIDNRALAALANKGADVHWLLTGERKAPARTAGAEGETLVPDFICPRGRMCDALPHIFVILADTMTRAASSVEAQEEARFDLDAMIAAVQARRAKRKVD
jgi:hypothetical protein